MKQNVKGILALTATGTLFFLTLLLLFFCPVGPDSAAGYLAQGPEFAEFFIGVACLISFIVCLTFTTLAIINYFTFKKKKFLMLKISAMINFICSALICAISGITGHGYAFVFFILGVVLFAGVYIFSAEPEKSLDNTTQQPITIQYLKAEIKNSGQTFLSIIFVFITLGAFIINSCVLLAVPLFSDWNSLPTISSIFSYFTEYGIFEQIFCIAFVLALIADFILLVHVIFKFFVNIKSFLKTAKVFALYNIAMTFFVMIFSLVKMFISKFKDEDIYFVAFVSVIVAYAIYIVFTIFSGRAQKEIAARQQQRQLLKVKRSNSILPLILQLAMSLITLSMLIFTLFRLKIDAPTGTLDQSYNGWQILQEKSGTFQGAVALVLIIFFMLSALFCVFSLLNYLTDSPAYKHSVLQYTYANLFFQFTYLAIGLFYILMVPSFDSLLKLVLSTYVEELTGTDITLADYAKTQTLSYIPFILGFILIVCMQVFCFGRKRFAPAKNHSAEALKGTLGTDVGNKPAPAKLQGGESSADPCPAFSELDGKIYDYAAQYQQRKTTGFEYLTLKSLTQFIINYAANVPERLSYNTDTISSFIAGLGASRLSILQGMSGTGKTSLPVVFMQAINGNCDLVEVESSWRDKNELLGYYNEFNSIYSPKKFTQFLYKAALNPNIPTFIVLDEMNLSRIEYYFSDFLSLMEMREEQRFIKLLDTQIYPPSRNQSAANTAAETSGTAGVTSETSETNTANAETETARSTYLVLIDGHTLKIPSNVWFIGTANRDESAFEISDKVYDRAQTMNFGKRAPKITTPIINIPPHFIGYDRLNKLFEDAKKREFNAENHPMVIAIEEILSNYKISFGNRILKQIEDYVKIYLACNDTDSPEKIYAVTNRAIENIMISKVLRKLELKIIEDKAHLIESFESINCKQCAEFVKHLADI